VQCDVVPKSWRSSHGTHELELTYSGAGEPDLAREEAHEIASLLGGTLEWERPRGNSARGRLVRHRPLAPLHIAPQRLTLQLDLGATRSRHSSAHGAGRRGPFGIFRGDTKGPDRGVTTPRYSLILLACGRFLCTYARRVDCQVLAEELAPLDVAWNATDPYAVTGPEIEVARWLLRCCVRGYEL
jgi:hypothetical protein